MLTTYAVSPDLASMLLFIMAGYPSDAAEVARGIRQEDGPDTVSRLIRALCNLARGALAPIITLSASSLMVEALDDCEDLATDLLYQELLSGVGLLADRLLRKPLDEGVPLPDPVDKFRSVQVKSVQMLNLPVASSEPVSEASRFSAYSTFSGPHHLASLLIGVSKYLLDHSIFTIPTPHGLDRHRWSDYLESRASRQPYLWENHTRAVKTGYLHPGVSAVVSFPTGAGKTTLAELKMAAALYLGGKVVYLAPTHALVGQTLAWLRDAFPQINVGSSLIHDGFYAEVEARTLPSIAVMTPERCLTLQGSDPKAFEHVRLVVFDECHLIHWQDGSNNRRNIDAMLCLLNLILLIPKSDYLLVSAMIANSSALAEWLQAILERTCLPLNLSWKPTRQARGCVVYESPQVQDLLQFLREERNQTDRGPSKAIKDKLTARPYALFCLLQTWDSVERQNYTLVPLLDEEEPVLLSANAYWYLTPNKNKVAIMLANRLAAKGVKTIIFAQNRLHVQSMAREVGVALGTLSGQIALTKKEKALIHYAVEELGSADHVLGPFGGGAVCHHGLLIAPERQLAEQLFVRSEGAKVIVATPTLAQGMNLPAEAVIIVGDERFDTRAGLATSLEAHELLNTAGRAGRAGYRAQGLVLVIPNAVVTFDSEASQIDEKWFDLQSLFAQSDQCLEIRDPIGALLDHIHADAEEYATDVAYFVNRLPPNENGNALAAKEFLLSSFSAYQARQRGEMEAYEKRIQKILALVQAKASDVTAESWQEAMSAKTGVPADIIRQLDEDLHSSTEEWSNTIEGWVNWFFSCLIRNPGFVSRLFKTENFGNVFSSPSRSDEEVVHKLFELRHLTSMWMQGDPLRELELAMGTKESSLAVCDNARKFIIRGIPQLSYAIGLLSRIHRERCASKNIEVRMPVTLATVSACLRDGQRTQEHLAVRYQFTEFISRKRCERIHTIIQPHLPGGSPYESFTQTRKRVRHALRIVRKSRPKK